MKRALTQDEGEDENPPQVHLTDSHCGIAAT